MAKMSEEDLKGAVEIASRYYGNGQQTTPRKRSLRGKVKDLVSSHKYKKKIKAKGKEYEDKLSNVPRNIMRRIDRGK